MSELVPPGPPIPKPSKVETEATALRSQWELANAPERTPEEFARIWMHDLRPGPESEELRSDPQIRAEWTLRHQLASGYGLETAEGGIPEVDYHRVARHLRWLGMLIAPEPRGDEYHEREGDYKEQLTQAEEFAYDYVHLVWKEAHAEPQTRLFLFS